MKIRVISVGKTNESYFKKATLEYAKRLTKYTQVKFVTIKQEKTWDNMSPAEEDQIKAIEANKILAQLNKRDYVIALDLRGKQLSSEGLAKKIKKLTVRGYSTIDFIIGGSLGLHQEVINRADESLSFSKMTFPHQLMKVILMEQIYRAFKINRNEPYHK
jgi:23S rRNA (pseudouridine1915-N3)-methyltransferase